MNNWSTILNNARTSADIVAILRNVLAQLDSKSFTQIEELFQQTDLTAQEKMNALENIINSADLATQQNFAQLQAMVVEMAFDLSAAKAAGAGANGFTDGLIALLNGRTQRDKNSDNPSLKDFGAKGEGADDTIAFQKAIATGRAINLSTGKYRVRTDNFDCNGKDVIFVGAKDAEIILIAGSGTAAFDVSNCKNVIFDNVRFSTEGNLLRRVMNVSATSYVENFSTTRCTFNGNVSLLRGTGSTTQLPSVTPYGFKRFVYNDNIGSNVDVSHVVLTDYPIYSSEFRRNRINNLSFIYFNLALTNGAANGTELKKINTITADNNIVTNDDGHWNVGGSGSYYTVLLFEGYSATWTNNQVSGMKANEANLPVYDAYLNCTNVVSDNNIYRNNANFHAQNDNNWLIKAKVDSTSTEKTTKSFTNNKYIIERDWLARIGQTACVHRIANTGVYNSGDVIIKGNTFNLHTLRQSNEHIVESIVFENNIINAKTIYSSESFSVYYYTAAVAGAKLSINNNEVHIDELSTDVAVLRSSLSASWGTMQFRNNPVTVGNAGAFVVRTMYQIVANKAFCAGNTTNAPIRTDYFSCVFRELYADQTVCNGSGSAGTLALTTLSIAGKSSARHDYFGVPTEIQLKVHTDATVVPSVANLSYLVRVVFDTATGRNELEFKYTLNYANGVYTVIWTQISGSTETAKSTPALTATDHALYSKATVSGTGSLALTAQFNNSAAGTYFRVRGLPTTACKYSVTVSAFEV